MKKLALFVALMLIPCSAFGLEMLTDSSMDEISGQSGVGIFGDDIQMFLNVELFAYMDCDGYTTTDSYIYANCSGSGAMFVVNNFQMDTININAIVSTESTTNDSYALTTMKGGNVVTTQQNPKLVSTSCGIQLFYDYDCTAPLAVCASTCALASRGTQGLDNLHVDAANPWGARFLPAGIMIDITDELPAGSEGYRYLAQNTNVKIIGVLIGLPTWEFYIDDMHFQPDLNDLDCDTWVANEHDDFGTIVIQGITFTILDGWIEIGPK
jgi:hypothetical protein